MKIHWLHWTWELLQLSQTRHYDFWLRKQNYMHNECQPHGRQNQWFLINHLIHQLFHLLQIYQISIYNERWQFDLIDIPTSNIYNRVFSQNLLRGCSIIMSKLILHFLNPPTPTTILHHEWLQDLPYVTSRLTDTPFIVYVSFLKLKKTNKDMHPPVTHLPTFLIN